MQLDLLNHKPTRVFVSYRREGPKHNEAVLLLAKRLRRDGIDCCCDQLVENPPEGWPRWMQAEITRADYVLLICTRQYRIGFEGENSPESGMGANWEGGVITQTMYEQNGQNEKFIPIVLRSDDIEFIPLVLRGTTRYDLSSRDGYQRLYARLTGHRKQINAGIGEPRRVAEVTSSVADALGLINRFPGLPLEVLASAVERSEAGLSTELVKTGMVEIHDGFVTLVGTPPVLTEPDDQIWPAALTALVGYIDRHRQTAAGRRQVRTAAALCELAAVIDPSAVANAFWPLDKLLKRTGDKRLVLKIANLAITASRHAHRTADDARAEAVALICGRSWVYQRVGKLDLAQADARRSRDLGESLHWDRNTAFCDKCTGRLFRLEAEGEPDPAKRQELLRRSADLLESAIKSFSVMSDFGPDHREVGDCYSLLGRTYFEAHDFTKTRTAAKKASARIADDGGKEFLDLQILIGDLSLASNDPDAAEGYYTAVVDRRETSDGDTEDIERSEIIARAFLKRGLARQARGRAFTQDFERAKNIWEALEDPNRYLAEWELQRTTSGLSADIVARLTQESPIVRVEAVKIHLDRVKSSTKALSRRTAPDRRYWEQLIHEGKRIAAIEDREW